MINKFTEQLYKLKAGQYFDVNFKNYYYFRINAVDIVKNNSVSYSTIIIAFGDDTQIISKPSESTYDLVIKFLRKVENLHSFSESDLTKVSDICSYEN